MFERARFVGMEFIAWDVLISWLRFGVILRSSFGKNTESLDYSRLQLPQLSNWTAAYGWCHDAVVFAFKRWHHTKSLSTSLLDGSQDLEKGFGQDPKHHMTHCSSNHYSFASSLGPTQLARRDFRPLPRLPPYIPRFGGEQPRLNHTGVTQPLHIIGIFASYFIGILLGTLGT